MFYRLKHLLLLILVISKLKCNNLNFNEIMVLNASYVCLHAFSLHRESPDLDPGRRTPHFGGGSVTNNQLFLVASKVGNIFTLTSEGQPDACSSRLHGKSLITLGLMYAAFPCISARDCFQDLNP
jgi:hypothetical protein